MQVDMSDSFACAMDAEGPYVPHNGLNSSAGLPMRPMLQRQHMNLTNNKKKHLSKLQHSSVPATKIIQITSLCVEIPQGNHLRTCTASWPVSSAPACRLRTLDHASGMSATKAIHTVDAWSLISWISDASSYDPSMSHFRHQSWKAPKASASVSDLVNWNRCTRFWL